MRKTYQLIEATIQADGCQMENRTAEWVRFLGIGLRAQPTTVKVESEATKRVLKECFDV